MFTRPTTFNFGDVFTYQNNLDNIKYPRPRVLTVCADSDFLDQSNVKVLPDEACLPCYVKAREEGNDSSITDLSQRKFVHVKEAGSKIIVQDVAFEGSHQEIWVPLYRTKEGFEPTTISFTCTAMTAGVVIPFGLVYNALRILAIPFLLLYHIGKAAYEIINRSPDETRTSGQIIWDHVVEWFDEVLSHIAQLFDTLFWRVASIGGHIVGIFEGLFINCNHRLGRKIVAWCECKANREVSILKDFKRKLPEGPDLSHGRSLYYGCWSVVGCMDKFKFFASYHAIFLAGCFQPVGVGILDEKCERVVSVRSDSGRKIADTCNAEDNPQHRFQFCI